MKVQFVVEPNDIVRMGQKMGVTIPFKQAEKLLREREGVLLRSFEEERDRQARYLVNQVQGKG